MLTMKLDVMLIYIFVMLDFPELCVSKRTSEGDLSF